MANKDDGKITGVEKAAVLLLSLGEETAAEGEGGGEAQARPRARSGRGYGSGC